MMLRNGCFGLVVCLAALRAGAEVGSWTPIGPKGATVGVILVEPNSSAIYLGTKNGSIFISTDRGETWVKAYAGPAGLQVDAQADEVLPFQRIDRAEEVWPLDARDDQNRSALGDTQPLAPDLAALSRGAGAGDERARSICEMMRASAMRRCGERLNRCSRTRARPKAFWQRPRCKCRHTC